MRSCAYYAAWWGFQRRRKVIFLVLTLVLVGVAIGWSRRSEPEAGLALQVDSYDRMQVSVVIEEREALTHWPTTAFNLLASHLEIDGPLSSALFVDAKTNAEYIDRGLKRGLTADKLDLVSDEPFMVISILNPSSQIGIDAVRPSIAEQLIEPQLVVSYEEWGMTTSPFFSGSDQLSIAGVREGQQFSAPETENLQVIDGDDISVEMLSGGLSSGSWSVPPKNALEAVDPVTLKVHPLAISVNVANGGDEGYPGRLIVPCFQRSSLHLWSLDQARLTVKGVYGPVHVNGTTRYHLYADERLEIGTVAKLDPSQAWSLRIDESGVTLSGPVHRLVVVGEERQTELMPTRTGLRLSSADFWIPLAIGIIVTYWFAEGMAALIKRRQDQQHSQRVAKNHKGKRGR